ncbi:hypothetical protein CALVIDRAFT_559051 [Calocera viscosa TUFC12733]|uniref:GIY-YIG domain-containing protein n=1 Tax=Calocera viscosa (strain TUFC12733) TaxID=1330018 RepID=A0A167FRT2_CALVF|nr:hypothetical protein CALVIDRAFT_559051 [Calocera viscosa TUFC12733]
MLATICRWAPRKIKVKPLPVEIPREHTFPPFYACYVLRSLGTRPRGRKTYIGTTTDPARRLRQHNGELTQGARKTSLDRPWIMSMLVHGFPSKLHALQFEWALQHPWKSRHLAHHFPTIIGRSKLPRIVSVVRTMVSSPTYHAWPLHVTLLDAHAVEAWKAAADTSGKLPAGCKVTTKKLRVTKAGAQDVSKAGFDIADVKFRDIMLGNQIRVEGLARHPKCSICREKVDVSQPLTTASCPSDGCTSVSHIDCLGRDFASHASHDPLLPRSGKCNQCKTTVLWGDVIRGCYHRLRQRTASTSALEDDALELDEEGEEAENEPSIQELPMKRKRARRKSLASPPARGPNTRTAVSKRKSRTIAGTLKQTAKSKGTTSRAKAMTRKLSRTKKKPMKSKISRPSKAKPAAEKPKRGRPVKVHTVVEAVVQKRGRAKAGVTGVAATKLKRRLKA